MRYFKKIKHIKETESEIQTIKNFLSVSEVKKILNYYKKSKNFFVIRDDGKKVSFNDSKIKPVRSINNWNISIKKIIEPKLKIIFPKYKYYIHEREFPPHIFESLYPTKVHVDTGRENRNEIPFKQILIPLSIKPNKQNVYTIFFKNRWYGAAANIRSGLTDKNTAEIKDLNNKFIKINNFNKFLLFLIKNKQKKKVFFNNGYFTNDLKFRMLIESISNRDSYNKIVSKFYKQKKTFSKYYYKKYLSHQNIEDFYGLKFWKAVKWEVGDVIIWDRNIIHCSNNFLTSDVSSKIGLSIFLNRKI